MSDLSRFSTEALRAEVERRRSSSCLLCGEAITAFSFLGHDIWETTSEHREGRYRSFCPAAEHYQRYIDIIEANSGSDVSISLRPEPSHVPLRDWNDK